MAIIYNHRMATSTAKATRITQLDGVRTIAIGMVFLNHAFNVKLMWAGVDLFFVLSGFLITGILIGAKHQNIKEYFKHFYGRRVRRILPPYLLLLIITVCIFGIGWLRYGYMYLFLMNLLDFFGMHHPPTLDLLWSLALEEQFYLLWPFVIFFCSEKTIARVAVALMVLAPIMRYLFTPHLPFIVIYMLPPFRMDLLALGALFAIAWRRRRSDIQRWGPYGLLLTAAACVTIFLLRNHPGFNMGANSHFGNVWIYELTLLASAGIVLWALGGRFVGVLQLSWVQYLGRVSYSFYLIHVTMLYAFRTVMLNPWIIGGLSFGASLIYAALSWKFLEKPILYAGKGSKVRQEARLDERAVTN